jgi:hypothetical protein
MLELTIETYNHDGLNRMGGGFSDFTSKYPRGRACA